MSRSIDIWIVYEFIKRLSTPWDQTEAFKAGLIDEKGVKIKSAKTQEEKNALTYFDRLIFNVKRVMEKVGLSSKASTFAGAFWLMREYKENDYQNCDDIGYIEENMVCFVVDTSRILCENAPANATGAAVVGTGDNKVHWSRQQPKIGAAHERQKKLWLDGVTFLRRKGIKFKR